MIFFADKLPKCKRCSISQCYAVVEYLPHSGHPSTSNTEENVENMKEIVLENPQYQLRKIANELNTVYGIAHHLAANVLGMSFELIKRECNEGAKSHTFFILRKVHG